MPEAKRKSSLSPAQQARKRELRRAIKTLREEVSRLRGRYTPSDKILGLQYAAYILGEMRKAIDHER